jgi:hypothetical protein
MADANRLAAALRYQQDMEGPVTMNPNIAEQGRKGRANMAPPTSVMDPRSRDYERRSRETENFLIGADILAGALPFAPLAKGAAMAAGRYATPKVMQGMENYMGRTGMTLNAAPQDEALRLAQQRAALPVEQHGLGLPADNTPQQRAAAMGFDIDAYKGMYPYDVGSSPSFGFKNGKFQQLDKFGEELLPVTKMVPELMSKMELGGKHAGFYGGKDVANRFAGYGTNSAVFPVKLNMGQNPLVKDASGQYAGRYQFERPARDAGMLDDYRDFHGAFFRDSPSTGAILKNTTDEGTIFIPKSGEQVRSRFAAFDPFRRNAALAATLSVAAPDLLAEEK